MSPRFPSAPLLALLALGCGGEAPPATPPVVETPPSVPPVVETPPSVPPAVETPPAAGPDEVDQYVAIASARGGTDAADVAAQPRSTKAGEPSVANSCNLTNLECYETASSAVGKGYYSTADKCSLGNFGTGPCPSENRVGFCLLSGGHQLVSMYRGPSQAEAEAVQIAKGSCGTYGAEWLGLPKTRPWPKT